MVPEFGSVFGVVVVLFCLAYFTMASIPFLFVKLDVPEVWRLFRGLFGTYFLVITAAALVATVSFVTAGAMGFAAAMLLLAGAAMAARIPVTQRMDAHRSAWESGDAAALRHLRGIHWAGMLLNTAILATVAASLPYLFR
ncbi:MAG TPA: hypothetical protein VMF90_16560 [Rhizobiaceae bacterium]|nr:hypothetical protein [Rhizobiaceae bacterium]